MHDKKKLEEHDEVDQKTSTPAQSLSVQDEFQVEVNRMRNSLNALTLKHFMFESGSREQLSEPVKREWRGDVQEFQKIEVAEPRVERKVDFVEPKVGLVGRKVEIVGPKVVFVEPKVDFVQAKVEIVEPKAVAHNTADVDAGGRGAIPKSSLSETASVNSTGRLAFEQALNADEALSEAMNMETQFEMRSEASSTKPKPETEIPFERRLSKHRRDPNRTKSGHVDPDTIIAALSESQSKPKKVDFVTAKPFTATPKAVVFDEVPGYRPPVLFKQPSRDSDEVAGIIDELPWQKKHQYRTVTPFFKKTKKSASHDDLSEAIVFRPIESSRSTEDVNKAILKPVPVFASKSFQEIPAPRSFKPFNHFQTKSSDDLLFDNIDGVRKPESKRHKLMRIRSTSSNTLNRLSDQLVYENFHYTIPEATSASTEDFMRKKAPRPLPRVIDGTAKRNSKTIVYVLDKERDEFVLEDEAAIDDAYEEVVANNQMVQSSDRLFDSLLDSRDDCECVF